VSRNSGGAMKKKLLVGLLLVAFGYLVLVGLRWMFLVKGWSYSGDLAHAAGQISSRFSMAEMKGAAQRNNIASFSIGVGSIEQKYEKIGEMTSRTTDFDRDEANARRIATEQGSLIQAENRVTTAGAHQNLQLVIGVPPGRFDAVVAALAKVGEMLNLEVTKTDKTNEYLDLRAKRTSLEKARDALLAMKGQGGKLEELIQLEREILKVEGEIQALGVQLGQFDKQNEFCTVRFQLAAVARGGNGPSDGWLLIEAMEWATPVYLGILAILFVGLLCVLLFFVIAEKAKIFTPPAP
jgi:hypothetical protein